MNNKGIIYLNPIKKEVFLSGLLESFYKDFFKKNISIKESKLSYYGLSPSQAINILIETSLRGYRPEFSIKKIIEFKNSNNEDLRLLGLKYSINEYEETFKYLIDSSDICRNIKAFLFELEKHTDIFEEKKVLYVLKHSVDFLHNILAEKKPELFYSANLHSIRKSKAQLIRRNLKNLKVLYEKYRESFLKNMHSDYDHLRVLILATFYNDTKILKKLDLKKIFSQIEEYQYSKFYKILIFSYAKKRTLNLLKPYLKKLNFSDFNYSYIVSSYNNFSSVKEQIEILGIDPEQYQKLILKLIDEHSFFSGTKKKTILKKLSYHLLKNNYHLYYDLSKYFNYDEMIKLLGKIQNLNINCLSKNDRFLLFNDKIKKPKKKMLI